MLIQFLDATRSFHGLLLLARSLDFGLGIPFLGLNFGSPSGATTLGACVSEFPRSVSAFLISSNLRRRRWMLVRS